MLSELIICKKNPEVLVWLQTPTLYPPSSPLGIHQSLKKRNTNQAETRLTYTPSYLATRDPRYHRQLINSSAMPVCAALGKLKQKFYSHFFWGSAPEKWTATQKVCYAAYVNGSCQTSCASLLIHVKWWPWWHSWYVECLNLTCIITISANLTWNYGSRQLGCGMLSMKIDTKRF